MTISELIVKLESIREKQGECEVIVDASWWEDFIFEFFVEDKWYSRNWPRANRCFILLKEKK